MDQLLQSLCGEASLHSASRFSLDLAARARKLQTYQTAEPSLFYLKWAQAGVAQGASRLEFRLCYGRSELEFAVGDVADADQWFGDGDQTDWVQLLRVAVEAALCENPRGLSLDLGGRQIVGWGDVSERRPVAPDSLRLSVFEPKRAWYQRFSANPRQAQIHREISARLALAPVIARLDGRVVNRPNPDFDARWSRPAWVELSKAGRWMSEWLEPTDKEPHYLLSSPWLLPARLTLVGGEEVWRSHGKFSTVSRRMHLKGKSLRRQTAAQPPVPHFWQQATGRLPGAEMGCDFLQEVPLNLSGGNAEAAADLWFYSEARVLQGMADFLDPRLPSALPHCPGLSLPALRTRRWLGLPALPQGPSHLFYVQHGLLLDPIEFSAPVPGTVAILARADVETDLSQMRPVEDDQVRQDLQWAKLTTDSLVKDIAPILRDNPRCERLAIAETTRNAWTPFLRTAR